MPRVEELLDRAEEVDDLRRVEERQQLRPGPSVAVLAGDRPAVAGDEPRRGDEEVPHHRRPAGRLEREVDAHVQAPVPEVPVGDAPQTVLVEQIHEIPEIVAEVLDRDRGILPPRVGVPSVGGAGDESGPVGADRPYLGGGVGIEDCGIAGARLGDEPLRLTGEHSLVVAGEFDDEPACAVRQSGDRLGALGRDDAIEHPRIEPFARGDGEVAQQRRVMGGGDHVRVPEDDRCGVGRFPDELHLRCEHDAPCALGAGEGATDVEAVLRQQGLESVAGDLPGERAEMGADDAEAVGDERVEAWEERFRVRLVEVDDRAVDEHDGERQEVRARPAVAERTRAARVVADHAADRAARVRRGVGSEAQTVDPGCRLQGGVDAAGLDPSRLRGRIEVEDRGHMAGEVEDDPGADRIAGDRRARTATRHRHAEAAGHREDRRDVVGTPREDDGRRHETEERGIGGVGRPVGGISGDLETGPGEFGDDVRDGGQSGRLPGERALRSRHDVHSATVSAGDRVHRMGK